MYLISLSTKLLHLLPSELAHSLALKGLKLLYFTGILRLIKIRQNNKRDEKKSCGLLPTARNNRIGQDKIIKFNILR